jgi:endonuclease III
MPPRKSGPPPDLKLLPPEEKIPLILERLGKRWPSPHRQRKLTPLDSLVLTILSQRVNDTNSDRAFAALKARFATWGEVVAAPAGEVEEAIAPAGLMEAKAFRIREALRRVREDFGAYAIDPLRKRPPEEAHAYLTNLPGIGKKTAAVVLLFNFGMPYFPVDTHVHRVSIRLGLIPPRTSAEHAHDLFEAILTRAQMLHLHLDLIWHGRRICVARKPRCPSCPLLDLCPQVGVTAIEGAYPP